jgi:hypothetical protein
MFRSYDYLQVDVYTSEINMTQQMQIPKFKIINVSQANSIQASHVNFRCIYFRLKMVIR